MKMKKYKINIIILVCVSLLVMFFIMKDNFNEIVDNIINANYLYLIIALLLMVLYVLFQSFSMHLYLKKIDNNYKFKDTFILMSTALLFNAITPFSSGGQPFQLYLLKGQGIKLSEAMNALLQNFFAYQLSLTILGTLSILINHFYNIIPNTSLLKHIVIIGFVINFLVLFILLFLSKAKKVNTKLFNKMFDFVFSFKFIKNREQLREKANEKIDEFYQSNEFFKDSKFILLKAVTFNTIGLLLFYLIPLFVFYSIGVFDKINPLDSFICSSYTYFIGSFVPIPGGTGGLEYAFIEFFRIFTNSTIISTCMILWRVITYYFPMILGVIALLFVKKKVK